MRRTPRRYVVLVAVAVLAVVASVLTGVLGLAPASGKTSAKDRIAADPPPALFDATAIAATERLVAAQAPRAHRLIQQWWARNGQTRNDAAFVAWLQRTVPGPPSAASRSAEMQQVIRLRAQRTKAGVAAATWLEVYGKKDLWKLYAHDQAELLPSRAGATRKADVKAMLKLTKTVADALGARYRQSARYVLRPALRPDRTVRAGQVCPCSYPSRHAAAGAAAATYLGGLQPERRAQYLWAQGQIDYSRVYMAGHVPSDLVGGALLGDLVGEYYLGSRS